MAEAVLSDFEIRTAVGDPGARRDGPAAYASRLGDPAGSLILLSVAEPSSWVVTWSAVRPGLACSSRATIPATCGAAIDVPLSTNVAVSESTYAEVTSTPGANRSTQLP